MGSKKGSARLRLGGVDEIPKLVRKIYRIVGELERLFPGRRFTPDGHLVGSIGEVLAQHRYALELLPPSYETHDAKSRRGELVQIKATQRRSVSLSSKPSHLLVLKLENTGHAHEIYNGPGALAWNEAGKMQKNGQRPISLEKLTRLMDEVDSGQQIPRAREGA